MSVIRSAEGRTGAAPSGLFSYGFTALRVALLRLVWLSVLLLVLPVTAVRADHLWRGQDTGQGAVVGGHDWVQAVKVVAVEYPPYTSQYLPGSGSSFRILRHRLEQASEAKEMPGLADSLIKPHFMPPARASYLLESGRWSASFFPPRTKQDYYRYLVLDRDRIELGLFRRISEQAWPAPGDLSGRVAVGRRWHGSSTDSAATYPAFRAAGLQPVPVDSLFQAFKLLYHGRVDFVFSEKVAGFYMQRYVGDDRIWAEFAPQPVKNVRMGIWLNLSDPGGALLYKRLLEQQPLPR